MSKPTIARCVAMLLAMAASGCATSDAVTGRAPDYPPGYQPVMDGRADSWPMQPGALWGPEDVADIDVFFAPLAAHGRWEQSRWGQVFVPAAPQGWRPYVNGQWLDNRYWLSGDPWGWATDHYGRWGFDQALGWVWVPGTNWGPSWAAWREADEVVGWAPIPPQVAWTVGVGFGGGFDNWGSWHGLLWVWVPRGTLYVSRFGGRILPWNVGLSWWGRSRWQHTPYWGWNRPWDRGWGWRAPGRGFGNQFGYGYGRGWNNNGWNNNGWNQGWNRGWNGGRGGGGNNGPRRGQPGSVGDAIGRDLAGEPQAQPGRNDNGGGMGNQGMMGRRPPTGQQAGDPNLAGRTGGGFGRGFGGGGAAPQVQAGADSKPSRPQRQRQPQPQQTYAPPPPRQQPEYRSAAQARSEPAQRREAPADRSPSGLRVREQ